MRVNPRASGVAAKVGRGGAPHKDRKAKRRSWRSEEY